MKLSQALAQALSLAKRGPRHFADLSGLAEDVYGEPSSFTAEEVIQAIAADGEAGEVRNVLRSALAAWDFETDPSWATGTRRGSSERRLVIYEALGFDEEAWPHLDGWIPPYVPDPPTVIKAEDWQRWYVGERTVGHTFYWDALRDHLADNGWKTPSLLSLDESSHAVVERLSDPLQAEPYQAKGLVVGYVQSGKTANITAVTAKAVDAGYRLVIVLAGTLDLLRNQTQRRLDSELVGKPLLEAEYEGDALYAEFLDHGTKPSNLGAFDWTRLTGRQRDYQALRGGALDALKFERANPSLPFNDPVNLHSARAKLIVIKKNFQILKRLTDDLARVDADGILHQVPALIIDDESDQASVNTRRPAEDSDVVERTKVNAAIVDLLTALPRAQYVGYTATPFANVFVDPGDAEDVFPRDFIVSLPRPKGYLGASDFHDLDGEPPGTDRNPFKSNERAFVRPIEDDTDQQALTKAIDSYLLAGAVKLFRAQQDPSLQFRHHTMMVHTSSRKADHDEQLLLVRKQLSDGGYLTGGANQRLQQLFDTDISPVSAERAPKLPLPTFAQVQPLLGKVWAEIHRGGDPVLLVNSNAHADRLAFDTEPVWKIIVGGAKLSRGFTVEGLTTTYFRRKTKMGDTLMQMGRWCGFRNGYGDLVRLFIGRSEAHGRGTIDVYEAFEAVCRDEKAFREELDRYALPKNGDPPITPMQIPPLVSSHLQWVIPTSRNKMYNARITYRNFGDRWSEHRRVAQTQTDRNHNALIIRTLLQNAALEPLVWNRAHRGSTGFGFAAGFVDVLTALQKYRWANSEQDLASELDFLSGRNGDPAIDDWLVVLPQQKQPTVDWPWSIEARAGTIEAHVHRRSYSNGDRPLLNAIVGPEERALAETVTGKLPEADWIEGPALSFKAPNRGVLLIYPIADVDGQDATVEPIVAVQMLFPPNAIERRITFSVASPQHYGDPVVDATTA